MGLNLAGLKYLHACSGKTVYDTAGKNAHGEGNKDKLANLVSKHNAETQQKLEKYKELHKSGKLSASDYRIAKLEAAAQDIIYQLGVNSLYGSIPNCRSNIWLESA